MATGNKELCLSKSALALYAKSRGKDFLDVDDFNFILENNSEFLMVIARENNLTMAQFRRLLMASGKIRIEVIWSNLLFATWILGAEFISLGSELKKLGVSYENIKRN